MQNKNVFLNLAKIKEAFQAEGNENRQKWMENLVGVN